MECKHCRNINFCEYFKYYVDFQKSKAIQLMKTGMKYKDVSLNCD